MQVDLKEFIERLVPEKRKGMRYIVEEIFAVPDVLFLAFDPSQYVVP